MGWCLWFLAVRNTSTNRVQTTFWPQKLGTYQAAEKHSARL